MAISIDTYEALMQMSAEMEEFSETMAALNLANVDPEWTASNLQAVDCRKAALTAEICDKVYDYVHEEYGIDPIIEIRQRKATWIVNMASIMSLGPRVEIRRYDIDGGGTKYVTPLRDIFP